MTGVTGSGKSTALAAMINHINRHRRVNIITIEDPIEFLHRDVQSNIAQREVGSDTISFGIGAPSRAAAGSRRDSGRRDPRHRDAGHRAQGGGHRPPGVLHPAHHGRDARRSAASCPFILPTSRPEIRMLLSTALAAMV